MRPVDVFVTLIILARSASEISSCESDYCYADDKDPYLYMSTRTSYRSVHCGDTEQKMVPNCEPVQLWMLARHGTRYPSSTQIEDILDLSDFRDEILENHVVHGRGELCAKDLENLKQWKADPKMTVKKAKFLITEGLREHNSLAKRLQNNYPELLNPDTASITSDNYKFRSTNTQRTIASMGAFMEGLFGSKAAVESEVVPRANDTLLKAYKICDTWQDLAKQPATNKENKDFLNSPEYQGMVTNVSQRLGFKEALPLEQINLLYQACRFEKAAMPDKLAPWCSVFKKYDLQVLEYDDDLYHYYHTSYGSNLSSAIGCPPLQDMFIHFLNMENGGEGEPKAVLYFAHDATIQLLYTAMGAFKDSIPITAANFATMENRKWRTSYIASFAANLVAVFYKCNIEGNVSYKVAFRWSEKPLILDGCESEVCDWDKVKNILGPVANTCNLDFCKRERISN